MADFAAFWELIKANEGIQYCDTPGDRGGPTKFGITLETLSRWRKIPCTATDVMCLQAPEARAIAKAKYWPYDDINNQSVAMRAADLGYNSGVATGIKALQSAAVACGATIDVDGDIGPATIAAVNAIEAAEIIPELQTEQRNWYWHCVHRDCVGAAQRWGWDSADEAEGIAASDAQDINRAIALLKKLQALGLHVGNLSFIRGWLNRAGKVY